MTTRHAKPAGRGAEALEGVVVVWFSPADGSDGSDDQPRQRREVVADNDSETERIAGFLKDIGQAAGVGVVLDDFRVAGVLDDFEALASCTTAPAARRTAASRRNFNLGAVIELPRIRGHEGKVLAWRGARVGRAHFRCLR